MAAPGSSLGLCEAPLVFLTASLRLPTLLRRLEDAAVLRMYDGTSLVCSCLRC